MQKKNMLKKTNNFAYSIFTNSLMDKSVCLLCESVFYFLKCNTVETALKSRIERL